MYVRALLSLPEYATDKQEKPATRKDALLKLPKHSGFRLSHPRADHFVPLYIAAGAGEDGEVRVLAAIHGSPTIVFGL